jgi:hypothetical protein
MKAPVKPKWRLTPEQREHLALLLSEVAPDAGEDDPRFIRLLELWETMGKPWDVGPTVPCYRCKNEEWVTGGVAAVLTAIGRHLEAGS